MSAPIASVVIPARNAAATIDATFEALAAQPDSERLDVIVVDNGSSDGTSAVALAWRDRLPGLRVVGAPERPNIGYARNVGVAAAQCDSVLFCDADDRVDGGWSRALLRGLESADTVGGLTVRWDGSATGLHLPGDAGPSGWEEAPSLAQRYGFLRSFGGNNFALKKSVWAQLGGFDETPHRADDIDMSWRAQLAGFSLVCASDAVVFGRERATSSAAFRQAFAYGQWEVALFAKFRPSGMPRSSTAAGIRRLGSLVRHLPDVTRSGRARLNWCARAGFRCGRVVGSVRNRVCYL